MRPRLYAPNLTTSPSVVRLPDDEARHLVQVLLATAGDMVSVFDGRGHEWLGRVTSAGSQGVIVQAIEEIHTAPESSIQIVVAQSVLKAEKMDEVVRDVVMIGAAALQPVISSRTAISASALARGRRVERWQRVALASAKQSGRAVVPPIRAVETFDRLIADVSAGLKVMFVEPSSPGGARAMSDSLARLPRPAAAIVAIGPEGGWSSEEIDRARAAGFTLCTLGSRTLRAERAPLVGLAVLLSCWNEL